MKRICMACQSYYLRDARVRREAEALAEAGFNVDVITLRDKGEPNREIVSGVNIFHLPLMHKRGNIIRYFFEYFCFFILSSLFLSYLYLKRQYNLIQIHTMPDFVVFSAIIPKILGAKIILDIHEPMPEVFMSKYKLHRDNFLIKLIRIQEKISFRFPNHLLTVHEPLRDLFIKRGVVKENKTDVVLNVPDTKIFKDMQFKKTCELDDHFILAYTGTVAERYGLDIAIRGIDLLRKKIPKLKLWILGEGEHLPYLKNLVTELNLESYIEFYKPVPITQIPDFLAKANVGISTHKQDPFWDVYFSTKVVEFLTIGLPVVVSRTKTIQYYFDDNMLFFFVPEDINDFAEKILTVYKNPSLAKEKVENARKCIKNLSWTTEKRKYIQLVESLINRC